MCNIRVDKYGAEFGEAQEARRNTGDMLHVNEADNAQDICSSPHTRIYASGEADRYVISVQIKMARNFARRKRHSAIPKICYIWMKRVTR